MTGPAPSPLSGFIGKLTQLKQLQLNQEAQRLAERAQGAQMIHTYQQLITGIPQESRDAFAQLYSNETRIPVDLLKTAALGPESVTVQRDRLAAKGAPSVNPGEVATATFTGMNQGQTAESGMTADFLNNVPANVKQIIMNRKQTGLPATNVDLPQVSRFATGMEQTPQEKTQANLTLSGINSNERIHAGEQGIQKAQLDLSAQELAHRLDIARETGGLTPANMLDAITAIQKGIDEASSGKLSKFASTENTIISRRLLGFLMPQSEVDKILPQGATIDNNWLQQWRSKIPQLQYLTPGNNDLTAPTLPNGGQQPAGPGSIPLIPPKNNVQVMP